MTTATVETLTASVNVLQYGNRQITLSVAKQLDVVSPYSIEPMGRVRLGKNDRPETSVIGSDESGNLVTADFHQLSNGYLLPKLDLPPRSFRVAKLDGRISVGKGMDGWSLEPAQRVYPERWGGYVLIDPEGGKSRIPWDALDDAFERDLQNLRSRIYEHNPMETRDEIYKIVSEELFSSAETLAVYEPLDELKLEHMEVVDSRRKEVALRNRMESLPLIVLAGR